MRPSAVVVGAGIANHECRRVDSLQRKSALFIATYHMVAVDIDRRQKFISGTSDGRGSPE